MALSEFLKTNAKFVTKGMPMVASGGSPSLVIASSNPQWSGLLDDALGLEPGAAVVIQVSGAWGGRDGEELLRSVVLNLYLHNCCEILVVGAEGSLDCPPTRKSLREAIRAAGIQGDVADNLLKIARGPASPRAGVLDTVRTLRNSTLISNAIPVHGCLLQADTGTLEVIDRDDISTTDAKARPQQPKQEQSEQSIPDFPLPELPDIPLPELPPLDLDAITTAPEPAPGPKTKPADDYGRQSEGAGPVPLDQLTKMPAPGGSFNAPQAIAQAVFDPSGAVATPSIQFEVPETAPIQDTGLGSAQDLLPGQPDPQPNWVDADVRAVPDVRAMADVAPMADVSGRPSKPPKAKSKAKDGVRPKPRPTPPRQVERPEVTPVIRQEQVQAPLGERVIEFDEATPIPEKPVQKGARTRVDIKAGYVSQNGAEFPLDPELQRALLKVARFLANEFTNVDRNQIMGRIRKAAHQGQQTGELLKLMIGPVLKLGKKRYAVINELLKIKEDLPRQSAEVAVALLEEILTGT